MGDMNFLRLEEAAPLAAKIPRQGKERVLKKFLIKFQINP